MHDPTVRERRYPKDHRAEKKRRRAVESRATKWVDLDENVSHGYILIDDKNLGPEVLEIDSEEMPFPESAVEYDDENVNDDDENDGHEDDDDNDSRDENIGSHGRYEWSLYKRLKGSAARRYRCDLDLGATYPLANSHGDAYQDSSSHSKYTELYSELRAKNNLDANRPDFDATSLYSIANSHSEQGGAMDARDRAYRENSGGDNLAWDTRLDANYEMANSHSNYRVFYDSQTQHYASNVMPPWSSELWSENRHEEIRVMSNDSKDSNVRKGDSDECKADESQSEQMMGDEQNSDTTCDIEQCLVQIEESLLNIEQNLLHVQDLDIPELRNLLYKSPSIERSLFEVQDFLYADGIVPVLSKKSMSLESEEEENEEEENEEEENEEEDGKEEVWVGQNITIKGNDHEDGDASAPLLTCTNEDSSDTANVDVQNSSRSNDNHCDDWNSRSNILQENEQDPNLRGCTEQTLNFVPNSLSKTLPRRIVLNEVKENIRLCSSEPEEPIITIDYNLNSACAEKNFCRDKWHSRTNSLDENSIFQNSELGDKQENGKSSLQDIFLESTSSRLVTNAKARSEGALQTNQDKPLRHEPGGSHEELLQAVEATAEDFRKRLESFASQRRSMLDRQKRPTSKSSKEVDKGASRSREKSPVRQVKRATTATASKTPDKDNGAGKSTGCDKRKKKKAPGKNQGGTSDNALVPSKLISLSLSLLLAALLQAVRCLTDLVEDAFRSVSYDRSGLLQ